jgi:predicted translin family RNA/ssDNA-binding protein
MNFKEYFEAGKLFEELMSEGVEQRDYAVDILSKITKVAEYLVHSRLNNSNDLDRFEKFLDMMSKEMPKLDKAIDSVRKDISGITQGPRRFNYNK